MDKAEKHRIATELNQAFVAHGSILLIDFTGINVAAETELRRKVAETGGSYRVVKNTLALRAAADTPVAQLKEHFRGPTAVALTQDDPVGLAKVLSGFLKAHPTMSFKVGVLDETVISSQEMSALAQMPSRAELLSKVVFLLQAPLRRLVMALQSPVSNLASLLKQLEERKEEKD